jgi:hypothetical protein
MVTIRRRDFLGGIVGAAGSVAFGRWAAAVPDDRIVLGVPVTHSDWMLKPGIEWGPAGVRHMLDACKASGWSKVYWRALDGGRSSYPSAVVRPAWKWDEDSFWSPQNDGDRKLHEKYTAGWTPEKKKELLAKFERMNYGEFDSMGEAVRYGHQIGLKVHAWVTVNEDDHGWGLSSDFAKAHPEFRWVRRDGRPYRSQMSFAFPEVRQYKIAILKELLEKYEIDGVFLDWIRTGDVRDNPQTDANGVADSGYETPNVDALKKRYGVEPKDVANGDERWVRTRAEPQTVFMRDVRKLVGGRVPVSVLVGHPWHYRGHMDKIDGSLRGLLLDVQTWAREGLMDAAVAAGYYRPGGSLEAAFDALKAETDGKVATWAFGWVPTTVAQFETDCAAAKKVGAAELLLWEGDYIDDRPNRDELQRAMRARAAGAP